MQTIVLTLPYPPSVNTYWGFQGHRRFLTKKALEFKKEVGQCVRLSKVNFGKARLEVTILTHAPDRRPRDIDNIVKPTLDALMQGGLFDDDSQIDHLVVKRGDPIKGGKTTVSVKVVVL
jgi:crossover junction endodeoxyribonuclease RusA